jgi:hypothetical protein
VEALPADVVLDDLGGVYPLEVADLAINDEVSLFIDLLDADYHDVGGEGDHLAEAVRGLDVGIGRPTGQQGSGHEAEGGE